MNPAAATNPTQASRRAGCVASLLAVALLIWASVAGAAGEIHRGLGPSPDTLDIHRAQGLSAFNLLRDLHEGLLTRDAAGRPVPGVARAWEVSDDGRTWTFELDPDARWSDGSPITTADFERGFARAVDPSTASPTGHGHNARSGGARSR